MTTESFLLVGNDKLPFSIDAIHLCGMSNGDRLASMSQYDELLDAEAACLEAMRVTSDVLVKSFDVQTNAGA